MLKCWKYVPEERPTCEGLQRLIAKIGYKGGQLRATTENKRGLEFWEAMKDESTVDIDYDTVESILLRVSGSIPGLQLRLITARVSI